MIKTKKLIKQKEERRLPALILLLSLLALVASMLASQSLTEQAEAQSFGTCPAGQAPRGQRLPSGGYRFYCVPTTTTTTTAPRRSSCPAGQYRWFVSFVNRTGCAPCPASSRTIPTGCAGYTRRITTPPTTRPPATTRAPRPTTTTAAPTATTAAPTRPATSCSAGQYYLVIPWGAGCVPCPTSMLRTALSSIPAIWPACQGHTTLTEPTRTPPPPTGTRTSTTTIPPATTTPPTTQPPNHYSPTDYDYTPANHHADCDNHDYHYSSVCSRAKENPFVVVHWLH